MVKKAIKKSLLARHSLGVGGPKVETEGVKKTKIRVVGIGGGGGSIVSEIASKMKKATFVVANTDHQALKSSSKNTNRFQFGESLTGGLGTGMNVELAQTAAQNEKERIKKIFQRQDLAILVACLGGGVGSGAAPLFAKMAKNSGLITFGVFTLPFKFEGERKMEIAKVALQKLKPNLNALAILPNERIFQIIDKNTPLKEALSAINRNLAESLEGLIETIFQPGLINIDFADLKTILEGRGRLAYLNAIEVEGVKGQSEAMKRVLYSPLYPYTISGAKGLLFNISGEKKLSLAEVSQVSKMISEMVNPEAKIIFGLSSVSKDQNKIKIFLLATGCQTRIFSEKPKKRKLRKKPISKLPPPIPQAEKKPPKLPERKSEAKSEPETKIEKKIKAKPKKAKIKIMEKMEKSQGAQLEIEPKTDLSFPAEEVKVKVRKNALQLKKEAEEAEREFLEREKIWETPAFLRRKNKI